jgi:RimJ/RimL family protein N-acetyltransferase
MSFSSLSFSNIWEAIKTCDPGYLTFLFEEWYIDNVRWRIEHHILGQRCENCRNWHYCGVAAFEGDHPNDRRKYGDCDLYPHYWQDYHGWCIGWNIDFDAEERGYTLDEDGCERVTTTLTGKKITQISRSGIWMYKHDGEIE